MFGISLDRLFEAHLVLEIGLVRLELLKFSQDRLEEGGLVGRVGGFVAAHSGRFGGVCLEDRTHQRSGAACAAVRGTGSSRQTVGETSDGGERRSQAACEPKDARRRYAELEGRSAAAGSRQLRLQNHSFTR